MTASSRANVHGQPQKVAPNRPKRKAFTLENQDEDMDFGLTGVLPYFLPWAFPLALAVGIIIQCNYLTLWVAFAVLPIMDVVVPVDLRNPTEKQQEEFENSFKFKLPLYLWVPTQLCTLLFAMAAYSGVTSYTPNSTWQCVGLLLSTGTMTGGIGITVSHELFHKLSQWDRFLGHALLASVNYQHFVMEHLRGHHKRVATPEDPASADLSQNVYTFYPRSLVLSYVSSWRMEARRLRSRGYSVLSPHNCMLRYLVTPLALALCMAYLVQSYSTSDKSVIATALAFFYIQGWFGAALLEIINFVEHYGLRREEISPGVYENVNITHSWNAPHRMTNYFLFKLQRHSDHHAHSLRHYHLLRNFEESPMLPTGYSGMAMLALVPPLWRHVMDPMVKHYNKSEDKSNNITKKLRHHVVEWFVVLASLAVSCMTFAM